MLLCATSSVVHAGISCDYVLGKANKTWRPGNDDLFMAFRSNAPDFWSFAKNYAAQNMPEASLVEGWVAGDPHLLNFGQVLVNDNDFELELNDLDDSGHAPLIFDVLRLMISVQVSPAEARGKDVWKAYLDGLNGEYFKAPKFVRKKIKTTVKDFLSEQQQLLRANIQKGKLNLKYYELSDMKKAPAVLQKAGSELKELMAEAHPEFQFIDWGWKSHTDGGSQGMPRVWILFKQGGNYVLREFKQMAAPATANYEIQPDPTTRINMVRKAYWGTFETDQYEVETVASGSFLARTRYEYPLNEKIKKALEDESGKLEDFSIYLGYRLGELHALQAAGQKLSKVIDKDEDEIYQTLKWLRGEYIKRMTKLIDKEK
jgi:hypothetical protein